MYSLIYSFKIVKICLCVVKSMFFVKTVQTVNFVLLLIIIGMYIIINYIISYNWDRYV